MHRRSKYDGAKLYKETHAGVPVMVGGTGVINGFKFSANFLDITNTIPTSATASTINAYRSLYERYAIIGVKFRFIPNLTVSSSTGQAADRVVYAINRSTQGTVTSELDLIRQPDCKFTNTNKEFSVYVKYPKPVLLEQIGTGGMLQHDIPGTTPGAGPGANVQFASQKGLTWLSIRMGINVDASGNLTGAHPDHMGLDLFITSNNPTVPEYQAYTMYKTIYFAFKEQE